MTKKQQSLMLLSVLFSALACGSSNGSEDDDSAGASGSVGGATGSNGATGGNGYMLASGGGAAGGKTSVGATGGQGAITATGGFGAVSATGGAAAAGGVANPGQGGNTALEQSCTAFSGEQTGVILEFDLDNTFSMKETPASNTCGTKWECTKKAFGQAAPMFPAGYAVGLTYYHVVNGGDCTDKVQGVEIGVISQGGASDPQVQALLNSTHGINNQAQIQMTPSHDAWYFAAEHVYGWTTPGYETASKYVVIMTDGVPTVANDCGSADLECQQGSASSGGVGIGPTQYQAYIDNVRNIREKYGIKTYFVGVPGSELTDQVTCQEGVKYDPRSKLSALATAGGTAKVGCSDTGNPYYCHIDLSDGSLDFAKALTDTLATISTSVASCTYVAPTLDLNQGYFINHADDAVYVNKNGVETAITRSIGCTDPNGWDFTDATQSTIQLCSSLCDTVRAGSMTIRVAFGCSLVG